MEPCLICTRVTLIFLWLLKRQKLYFAFWYFNALVCFITLAKREIKDSRLQECPKVALPKQLTIIIPVLTIVSSPDVTVAIVARNYRKKIEFLFCKRQNFAGLQAHRKRPTSHHARFTALLLSPQDTCIQKLKRRVCSSLSLQCRRILGGRNLVRVRNIVVAAIFDFMTVEDWGE